MEKKGLIFGITMEDRVRVKEVKVLSNDWYVLKKTIFDFRLRDGSWQTVSRETYDRGNGATILLFNRHRKTVLLTRQFRYPAYVNGCQNGMLIEACAGLLENERAEDDPSGERGRDWIYPGTGNENVRSLYEPWISDRKAAFFYRRI